MIVLRLLSATLITTLVAPGLLDAAGSATKPNIVLILADDLGYGDLGCYGNKHIHTPHLDKLAERGLRFTCFYTDAPVCSPTRASLMTGQYPQRHGLTNVIETTDHKTHLSPEALLLPQLLQQAGYTTAVIGKWHLGEAIPFRPNQRGFDCFFGNLLGGLDFFRHDFVNGQHDLWLNNQPVHHDGKYVTDLLAQKSEEFIGKNAKKPFFLFLSFQAVHTSMGSKNRGKIQAPERWLKKYANGEPTKADYYRSCVSALDEAVGRVVAALEKHDLRNNTIIFFLSDNGPEPRWTGTAAPFFGTKHSLWEGGVRVPLLVTWPGRFPAKQDRHTPAMTHDIMPTVLDIAKVTTPDKHKTDGVSLLPILQAERTGKDRTLYWSYIRDTLRKSREKAVRQGKWKWLNGELYDLQDDPSQRKNLAFKFPKVTVKMETAWRRWVQQFPAEVKRWGDRTAMRHKQDQPN